MPIRSRSRKDAHNESQNKLDYTEHEIRTQVDAWRDAHNAVTNAAPALTDLWQNGAYDYAVFTGCGSTFYLAQTAANLIQSHIGLLSRAVPASELLLHPESVYAANKRTLLVVLSRSATTSETLQAVEQFKAAGRGEVVVISCYGDKPMNAHAAVNLVAEVGQEVSVAQTRSFSSMLVMAEGMVKAVAGQTPSQQFPEALHGQIAAAREKAAQFADPSRFERVFYLGSGPRYGLAAEAMLKMKEMSLTSAEAFHPLEFRHGPKSMVDERTLIVGLLDADAANGRTFAAENAVLNEMQALGATVVTLTPDTLAGYEQRPALVHYLPFVQWLAYLRAVNKGLTPDTPRHLTQVVIL